MKKQGQSLDKIVDRTSELKQVRKDELHFGDLIVISTQNSVYSIRVLDNGFYLVSGGWWVREVRREYHFLETQRGDVLWIYYDRHRRNWMLQGQVD